MSDEKKINRPCCDLGDLGNDEQTAPFNLKEYVQQSGPGRQVAKIPAWATDQPDMAQRLISRPGHLRLALTGGIATGKSTVAQMMMDLGAAHIDFDILARRAVEPGSSGHEEVVKLFGPEVVTADGSLDRAKIGRAVFSDQGLKKQLEEIIHPRTWELMGQELDRLAEETTVVLSIPLLFETGMERFFSPIVLVFTDAQTQLERLLSRNPTLSRPEAENILASQWPAPPKVMGASFVINNCGSLENTARQVKEVWEKIVI